MEFKCKFFINQYLVPDFDLVFQIGEDDGLLDGFLGLLFVVDSDGEVLLQEVTSQKVLAVAAHVVELLVEGDVTGRSNKGSVSPHAGLEEPGAVVGADAAHHIGDSGVLAGGAQTLNFDRGQVQQALEFTERLDFLVQGQL